MANQGPVVLPPLTIVCQPAGNIRVATITTPAGTVTLDNSRQIRLHNYIYYLAYLLLSAPQMQELENLYRLYMESSSAQTAARRAKELVPANRLAEVCRALSSTMRNRDGSVVQASTLGYFNNLPSNCRDKILSILLPLFKTAGGIVIRCIELDCVLGLLGVRDASTNSKYTVYFSGDLTGPEDLQEAAGRGGETAAQLADFVRRNKVLKHSRWALFGGQIMHAFPDDPLSIPVYASRAMPVGPTLDGLRRGAMTGLAPHV